jgi:hypothetical protein
MSTGNLRGEKKPAAELYQMLGEGDTSALYARRVNLDHFCDIPYGGGVSVDGRTVYIDRSLYEEIMEGKVAVRGMAPGQVIQVWIEHEHTEKAIDDGDNPVDTYQAAHAFATAKEEDFVKKLGVDPERYEAAIRPALERCAKRDPKQPPKDLWCGPYLDEPTPRDKELLRIFRAKGVADAFKKSKIDAGYGIGATECRDCKHYAGGPKIAQCAGGPKLAQCEIVCGLVRANRHCDWFEAK